MVVLVRQVQMTEKATLGWGLLIPGPHRHHLPEAEVSSSRFKPTPARVTAFSYLFLSPLLSLACTRYRIEAALDPPPSGHPARSSSWAASGALPTTFRPPPPPCRRRGALQGGLVAGRMWGSCVANVLLDCMLVFRFLPRPFWQPLRARDFPLDTRTHCPFSCQFACSFVSAHWVA
jgi:hypothetical protein